MLKYTVINNMSEMIADFYLLGLVWVTQWSADEIDAIAKMQVGETIDFDNHFSVRRIS